MMKYDDLKVVDEGSTTTSANVLFDILEKFHKVNTNINFSLKTENKLSLKPITLISIYFVCHQVIFQLSMIHLKVKK